MKKLIIVSIAVLGLAGCAPDKTAQALSQGGPVSLQAKLQWTSNKGEQQGFYVEESTDGTHFSQVLTVPDGTNSVVVTVPTAGQTYYFRVRGYNQAGTSPYTSIVKVAM
jgi:hypothetical protein